MIGAEVVAAAGAVLAAAPRFFWWLDGRSRRRLLRRYAPTPEALADLRPEIVTAILNGGAAAQGLRQPPGG